MKKINFIISIFFVLGLIGTYSCKKYLEAKPSTSLSTPSTLEDLQSLLDSYNNINQYYPGASEILSDDYYITTGDLNILADATQRHLYLWQKDDNTESHWKNPYNVILTCNIVLDELPKIEYETAKQGAWNNIKGSALFLRAYYFYGMSQLYTKPYNKNTSSTDLGIPLRLNSDINELSVRSSVEEMYNRIVGDLKSSVSLLPDEPLIKSRPGKAAAYGALARTYLAKQQYDSAGIYADLCLAIHDSLLDYNTLIPSLPIERFNKEVIFHMRSSALAILGARRAKVDSTLYNCYDNFDLRKTIFFKANISPNIGTYKFIGDYDGGLASDAAFTGIVTDEMYLIRAESYARAGNTILAMADLNKLLENRYAVGHFSTLTATDANDALAKILKERRKELVRRGTRWTDIRRLITDPQLSIIPKRVFNNQTFFMSSNNTAYIMQLPATVIALSGMLQNE